jgi:hypothetical protein
MSQVIDEAQLPEIQHAAHATGEHPLSLAIVPHASTPERRQVQPMVVDPLLGTRRQADRSPSTEVSPGPSNHHLTKKSKPTGDSCPRQLFLDTPSHNLQLVLTQPQSPHNLASSARIPTDDGPSFNFNIDPYSDPPDTPALQQAAAELLLRGGGSQDILQMLQHMLTSMNNRFDQQAETSQQQAQEQKAQALKHEQRLNDIVQSIKHLQDTVDALSLRVQGVETDIADLQTRLTAVETAQHVANSADAAQATTNASRDIAWMKHSMAEQLTSALQPHIAPVKLKAKLKPVQYTPEAYKEFGAKIGSLTASQMADKLGLPAGTPVFIRAMHAPRIQPRDPIQRCDPGTPCEEIVLEFTDMSAKSSAMSYLTRTHLRQNHGVAIHDYLLPQEIKDKKHLQANAMQALRDEHGLQPGWRRGQLTWKVMSKNNFATLSACEIPPNPTPEQLALAVAIAEDSISTRQPLQHVHPAPPPDTGTANMDVEPSSS